MAYNERAHEPIILLMYSLSNKLLEMVTDNTKHLQHLTRANPGSGGNDSCERLFLLCEKTVSADLDQFSTNYYYY